MPSLTRSGRPSFSFASSPPSGRTSTALRVEVGEHHRGYTIGRSGAASEKESRARNGGASASSDSSPCCSCLALLGLTAFTFGLLTRGRRADPRARSRRTSSTAGRTRYVYASDGHTILAILRGSQARVDRPLGGDLALDQARDRRDRGQALLRAPRHRRARHPPRALGRHHARQRGPGRLDDHPAVREERRTTATRRRSRASCARRRSPGSSSRTGRRTGS